MKIYVSEKSEIEYPQMKIIEMGFWQIGKGYENKKKMDKKDV